MSTRRSASVGALPIEKKHFVSRNESSSGGISLDVRCACQFYQSTSLLPERTNPILARPTSQLEYHQENECLESIQFQQEQHQQQQQNSTTDQLKPTFLAGTRLAQPEPERLSVRSLGRNISRDQKSPTVDISFLQQHPDLEEAAKTRGLVVRRISDANVTQLHGMQRRSRFTSVDRMSSGSGGGGGGASGGGLDLETISMRSGVSLRRISRSPSKADLFVADLNIPSAPIKQRSQRSVSASRRSSNVDLSSRINLIAATPVPSSTNKIADVSRSPSRVRSPPISLSNDYTNSRRPMSPDYMRPSESQKENLVPYAIGTNNILPQNRPIDVSKYDSEPEVAINTSQKWENNIQEQITDHLKEPKVELEESRKTLIPTDNKVNHQHHVSPPQIAVPIISLNVEETTNIHIKTSSPQTNYDNVVQQGHEKNKSFSKGTLPIPDSNNKFMDDTNESTLKRAHSPERRNSVLAILAKKHVQDDLTDNKSDIAKPSYTSRFMSMFTSKSTTSENEELSSKNVLKREKSPLKVTKLFTKDPQPSQAEIMGGSTAIITNKPIKEAEPAKVTETFSLKVDEMDQYMIRPKVSASISGTPTRRTPSMIGSFSSRDDLRKLERSSTSDIKQSFTPVIIPRNSDSTSFLASDKTLYSSESQLAKRLHEAELQSFSKEPSIHSHLEAGGKPLFAATIILDGNRNLMQNSSQRIWGRTRSPSEQKISSLHTFTKRTQSQDRHRMSDAQEYLSGVRMTKTVSFNFGQRQSRLSDFENLNLSQDQTKPVFVERSYFSRDHEYEPIGSPSDKPAEKLDTGTAKEKETPQEESISTEGDTMKQAETVQRDLETHFFNSTNVLSEAYTDAANGFTVYKDTVTQEPLNKQEKKGFMASAQNHTRKMHAGLKSQAGKLKTKLRPSGKKSPAGSPKFKARKRFKAPEFSKIKMPDIKRPDMSKLKRPEFTKFNKIDMSKFKFPEKITPMKLKRSKSLKENEEEEMHQNETAEISPKSDSLSSQKKLFDFNFGTYPRALSRNKKKREIEPESSFETTTEATSAITSTGTQPSLESSSSPQGDRGPGPVRSRWADKFSDVSYNDSEGSRYRRFESEQGSFDRESSMERRIREDVEDTASEDPTLTILGGVTDNKQFAEFDEENRAIHEISNLRSGEFKRRPIVHQDSDVKSDDSKDVIGWTEKDIAKNTLLLRGEMEVDEAYMRRQPEDSITQETQSTASSGKKLVLEEIDEDEFFLRKRGISQDNIELRQYITDAIRGKYDKSNEQIEDISYEDYGHTPPPKPRRLYRAGNGFQRNYFDDDNENVPPSEQMTDGTDPSIPKIPLRKLRGRRKYSTESGGDEQSYQLPYFDNDEDYLRPPSISQKIPHETLNNLNSSINQGNVDLNKNTETMNTKPQPPKRHKRRREISLEKESFINGFGGRSVSNSFLQTPEDVIVYRTEHEYHHIPLATPEKISDSLSIRKSLSNYDDYEDRKSHGAVSLEPTLNTGISEKYLTDLSESDGYAVVKKDHVTKPTPPARRKKFARLPGERFATMPSMVRSNRSTSPPERPPPPKAYTLNTNRLTSAIPNVMQNLNAQINYGTI